MNIIVTVPHTGRYMVIPRQILIRGAEIPVDGELTVDVRDHEHDAWTPLTLIDGADVELRAE